MSLPTFLRKCALAAERRFLRSNTLTRPFSTVSKLAEYDVIEQTGNVSPEREVPKWIDRPTYVRKGLFGINGIFQRTTKEPDIKNDKQIQGMRDACKVARDILDRASELVKPGQTTEAIDILVHEACVSRGCYPSPLNYKGFPKSVCTSVNNVACHGIPDDRQLLDGDIINIDVTVFYKGFHGDLSKTYLVGSVDDVGRRLVDSARRCRDEAIAICGPGVPLFTIGHMIQYMAEDHGFDVIPYFCGHGIGEYFHGPPEIFHFANSEPGEMAEGMTFTIEPIVTEGATDISILEDGWTAVSQDNSRSAQFEHTILITNEGCEILTQ